MRKAQFKKSLPIPMTEKMYNSIKSITDEKNIAMAVFAREAIEKQLNEIQGKEN